MDRLDALRIFVRVVETGSFSKAAKLEGIVQSTASKQVASLERQLGARLLLRTSRGITTTPQGHDYYESLVSLLSEFDAAEARVVHGQRAPSGQLRVAVPSAFSRLHIIPLLGSLTSRYPGLHVEFEASDRYVNLEAEGFDLAIRIGPLPDSSLVARRIATFDVVTVASTPYLAKHGEPRRVRDLGDHACITFMFDGKPRIWTFGQGARPATFTPNGALRFNDAESIRAAVLADLGIAHGPGWLFTDALRAGLVTRLLTDRTPAPVAIHAVMSGGRQSTSRAKVFVDFLAESFASSKVLKAG